jgi:hypothetical protein
MIFQALNKPKTCTCGKTHYIAVNPKINEVGIWFNCSCNSTLLSANEAYLTLQKARLNVKQWAAQAFKELGI